MIFCLLSLFLPSTGWMLVTSHHPANCPVPQVSTLILEDAVLESLFPAAGLFGGQGLVWSTLTLISPCPLSLSLSSPWTHFLLTLAYLSNDQSREGNIAEGVLEPAVRLDYTSACKSEQNLICASYRSLPPPTPRIWITSKDSLIQNKT